MTELRSFEYPVEGHMTDGAGNAWEIHRTPRGPTTWACYPVGAGRKERRRLDVKLRKMWRGR